MKDKFGLFCKAVVIFLAVALAIMVLIALVDTGLLQKLYEAHFLIVEERNEGGTKIYVEAINWPRVKYFIFSVIIAFVILWGTAVFAAVVVWEKKLTKRAAIRSSRVIRDFFAQDDNDKLDLPNEYADVVASVREIKAHRKRSEQMLQYEASRKNDLIAYLAHDLKTPLTSIIGYLSLLREAPEMPTEQRAKYVDIAFDKALRLEKLINEFFEITRFNLHEITLEKETLNLTHMLTQMADEFYPVLMNHGNTISIKVSDNLVINADRLRLARVFNNILKNAIAYSYADTSIEICAKANDRSVVITFTNRGQTIPKQKIEAIFEKFYRLDDSRSSNTGGAGLGLAIAKEIITLHGGNITASSENEIIQFTITLPM